MYKNKTILAVVPARGGSKGVPLKNIHELFGTPLVGLTGECVGACRFIDRAVVSTDHEEIAAIAESSGLDAPFRRPPALSGDSVADHPVLVHALEIMEALDNTTYDIVLMLQPTSPMRRPAHIEACLDELLDGDFDAVWTVSETDSKAHPLKQLVVSDAGVLSYYDPAGADIIARQQLSRVYHRNGACYAITRQCLLEHGTIKGERTGAVVTEKMVSIDTLADFELIEFLENRNQASQT